HRLDVGLRHRRGRVGGGEPCPLLVGVLMSDQPVVLEPGEALGGDVGEVFVRLRLIEARAGLVQSCLRLDEARPSLRQARARLGGTTPTDTTPVSGAVEAATSSAFWRRRGTTPMTSSPTSKARPIRRLHVVFVSGIARLLG